VKQSESGGILKKRTLLALRMAKEKEMVNLKYLPQKRVNTASGLDIEEKLIFILRERLRAKYRARFRQNPSYTTDAWDLRIYRIAIFFIAKFSFFSKQFRRFKKKMLKG